MSDQYDIPMTKLSDLLEKIAPTQMTDFEKFRELFESVDIPLTISTGVDWQTINLEFHDQGDLEIEFSVKTGKFAGLNFWSDSCPGCN